MFLLTTPFRGVWSNCLITSDAWTSLLASTVWGLVAESVASYALTTPGGDETLLDGNCCDGRAAAAAVGVVECSGGLDNSVTLFLVLLVAMAAISRWREIHSRKGFTKGMTPLKVSCRDGTSLKVDGSDSIGNH